MSNNRNPHSADENPPATTEDVQNSQTASEYINEQLALEADAREILPYKFDKCTYSLGPLRQGLFACLTCSPPPASPAQVYTPAGICYACSISCHGEHTLVELFTRRNFACDCGTTRFPSTSPCTLRSDPETGAKGVHSQEAFKSNTYNQNFQNRFCGCGQEYDAETEKGTMYQCLGLGTVEDGGCGEDWWHAHCLMGLSKDWPSNQTQQKPKQRKTVTNGNVGVDAEGDANNGDDGGEEEEEEEDDHPVPEGFPDDENFTTTICYKCVEANPWIKQYAGTKEFLPPLYKIEALPSERPVDGIATAGTKQQSSLKRKMSDDDQGTERPTSPIKRLRENDSNDSKSEEKTTTTTSNKAPKHESLPSAPSGTFSLLAQKGFREEFCRCPQCFPKLAPHQQLQEEEDEYEPSLSDSEQSLIGGSGARSQGTGSLLERGEAALNNVDRVRAIEGVMVYNHLKDKVKAFLKPYAESGKTVGADDIKAYFEKLRGDEAAIKEAAQRPTVDDDDATGDSNGSRKEQSGY